MVVLAVREKSAGSRLIGYQHAAITPRHTSLLFAAGEWDSTPLPDEVVTTGDTPARILSDLGRYPHDRIHSGVGLRQLPAKEPLREEKAALKRILVILSSSVEEYVKSLTLLMEGFHGNTAYDVVIRCHPTIPLSAALKFLPELTFTYRISTKATAAEELRDADVVFYTSSTVALEAAAMGIPLLYLDLGDCMDPDPLFDFSDLKWSIRTGDELVSTLQRIDAMPPAELQKRRQLARAYSASYIRPADTAGMSQFVDFVLARRPLAAEMPHRMLS